MEGVGEKVGQEPALGVPHSRDVGDQPQSGSAAYASHHSVKADLRKILPVRFGSDPVVPQEHHGLPARLMDQIHQFFRFFGHKSLDKIHVVQIPWGGNPEGGIIVPVVHDVLGPESVAVLFLEFLQSLHRNRGAVSEPVHKFLFGPVIEHQSEMVEKGGKPHHVGPGIVFQPLYQVIPGVLSGGSLTDVKGNLMRLISPVVGNMVVHLSRIPDGKYQKRHGVLMKSRGIPHGYHVSLLIHLPPVRIHRFPRGPVHDLPPPFAVMDIIGHHLLVKIPFHKRDLHLRARCGHPGAHQVQLLALVHMLPGKLIVPPGHKIGGIDGSIQGFDLLRQFGAVAVPQGIGPPALHHLFCLLQKISFTGKSNTAFGLRHFPSPF